MVCAANVKHIFTFGHKRNQTERPSGERSGLAMVDVWWPERGRMHVAGGENTGQPGRDLGPHSRTKKDSNEYYCALLPKSPPTIYKRLAGTHKKKYRGEMVAAVTAAATLLCAKRRHGHCAASDFPSSPQTARFLPNTYFSSNSGSPHLACREPERRTVAILMARFASPPLSSKISFYTLIMSAYKRTPLCSATKGGARPDHRMSQVKKMHLSSCKREAPGNDCSMAAECGVKTS